MADPTISIQLASDADARHLAALMTAAFSASDAVYPLIWGKVDSKVHDLISERGLFTPVQKEGRMTYKAVDAEGMILGFATWTLPTERKETKEGDGLPDLPGVNMELWTVKVLGMRQYSDRDVDVEKDMFLQYLFVDPAYHRRGIGSLLLEWGSQKADDLQAKVWLTSTPVAVKAYEKNGWCVKETHEILLGQYGGEGTYTRAWMLREPRRVV
ncbi:hypothetical protein BP5796_07608 [Coleophoma crateriformis]|uniref:N-acetyltransferase domain-containing protein n=1 Tax=Coleophoma crateriformis TaxID=565419 RepID=A0A3D8RJM8_9HELO|nr:hypothetical protein BP5796_07608 [Coleophoma crateriformis]